MHTPHARTHTHTHTAYTRDRHTPHVHVHPPHARARHTHTHASCTHTSMQTHHDTYTTTHTTHTRTHTTCTNQRTRNGRPRPERQGKICPAHQRRTMYCFNRGKKEGSGGEVRGESRAASGERVSVCEAGVFFHPCFTHLCLCLSGSLSGSLSLLFLSLSSPFFHTAPPHTPTFSPHTSSAQPTQPPPPTSPLVVLGLQQRCTTGVHRPEISFIQQRAL